MSHSDCRNVVEDQEGLLDSARMALSRLRTLNDAALQIENRLQRVGDAKEDQKLPSEDLTCYLGEIHQQLDMLEVKLESIIRRLGE